MPVKLPSFQPFNIRCPVETHRGQIFSSGHFAGRQLMKHKNISISMMYLLYDSIQFATSYTKKIYIRSILFHQLCCSQVKLLIYTGDILYTYICLIKYDHRGKSSGYFIKLLNELWSTHTTIKNTPDLEWMKLNWNLWNSKVCSIHKHWGEKNRTLYIYVN